MALVMVKVSYFTKQQLETSDKIHDLESFFGGGVTIGLKKSIDGERWISAQPISLDLNSCWTLFDQWKKTYCI